MQQPRTDEEIQAMREGGHMLAEVLRLLKSKVCEGISPKELAEIAKLELRKLGGQPAFLGVLSERRIPFPSVICISVNDQVQHSIPSNVPLEEGDVLNLDFGVRYKGMITDAGISVGVGKISADNSRLLKGTQEALETAVATIRDGVRVGDVSYEVQKVLERYKLGIVRDLVGHGVGHELHEEPEVPNYGKKGTGALLKTGMTICVEPITTLGNYKIYQESDGWTLRTVDGSNSAQFEHTILVLDDGCEILSV